MGLRERKKREARQHISDVATGLFAVRGFDAVTIVEIAEAAGVAKATVTNYFARKEDLVLDRQVETEGLLVDAIGARAAGQSAAEAVRGLLHRLLDEGHGLVAGAPRMFGQLVADSPALLARAREQREQLELSVARLLLDEGDDPVAADLMARVLLAAVTTVVVVPARRLLAGEDPAAVAAGQKAVIDRVFDLLGGQHSQ
ncbi:TetR/AcrR family transcriptional regulator [Cryptosporangium phraense]|uniref:TetR/AcrR family transcriptional regulator n=1 Tax=Cryptosporangium phraense TaxID=2593070 RepID=A0A545AJ80_9ACTN|nr:TetR/AcrR family transcriptional regulator [Cryptosporangium phraense]TQS41384.1 TetR/AcrR family transcriptional regulator [Cryptosporangium phraense]